MKNMKLVALCAILFSSTVLMAEKPVWAGNGGKPSKYEKEDHKREMTSKNEDKKRKKDKKYKNDDRDYDRNYDRERDRSNDRDYKGSRYGTEYEGQGQSDSEFIEKKTDETKKNWIGKFFDFLN